ncbi:ABC transporter permease [Pseudodonghicola xiamenensis]|uniref:ABC transporter permease n=1 Tax=Pseudodonghicola xiamenensis TaxID=337702 RepID=A0A8J3MED8_9RHOB|nr:ABC transporter permease [Pseudodonghicola xiamenensis]GHH02986.1 ABC transporter permease [Pseudodonghicola xiamenensis]
MQTSTLSKLLFHAVIVLLYGFLLLPVVAVTFVSFFDSQFLSFPPPGYTLNWFANALDQADFVNGFLTSTKVALIATVIGVTSGMLASIALVNYEFRGKEAIKGFLLAPLLVPGIVIGTALYVFFIQIAQMTGYNATTSMRGLVIAHVMLTIPWSVRLIVASMGMLDRSVEEAARNLGASAWTTFYRITLPRMRSGIVAAALFSFVISFENLEVSVLLVSPGNTSLPIAMLQYLEWNMDPTLAAASTIQILIIGSILLISDRFVKLSQVV